MDAEQREAGAEVVVWEIRCLFETGLHEKVDVVVVVDAPAGVRLRRIVETRGLGEDEAVAIMEAQLAASEKRRRADVIVENAGGRRSWPGGRRRCWGC